MIYFVTIVFSEQVHAQAYGFTRVYHCYAWAESSEDAAQRAVAYYERTTGIKIERAEAKAALHQEIRMFTFPNQIIDAPQGEVDAVYDRRGYSADLRSKVYRSELALS